MNDILPLTPPPLPFALDDKIFYTTDEEGEPIGEPWSFNDWKKELDDISGINEDLLGKRVE